MSSMLRFRDLKSLGIVSNWPSLLRWIDHEGFPPGLKLAANSRAWRREDVDAWLASRPSAAKPAKADVAA